MNFWDIHGAGFIFCMFFFPRLTMLFGTSVLMRYGMPEVVFLWAGWTLFPRITVAIMATILYGHTNLILVALTWLWAISGETTEKKVVVHKSREK